MTNEVPANPLEYDVAPIPPDIYDERTIALSGTSLDSAANRCEEILVTKGARIYQRGARLVRPVKREVPSYGTDRKVQSASLAPIDERWFHRYLSKVLKFIRYDRRLGKWYRCDPPLHLAQAILANSGEWAFPHVIGILTCPTLRRDGSILAKPGYDAPTGIFMQTNVRIRPPETPSRSDAVAALSTLNELLNEFPFVSPEGRSVALSALITPVVGAAIKNSPLHVIAAPTPGSGKSYLVDLCSVIVSGEPCPIIAAGRTEEETEKRLGAAMLAGYPLLSIDNVNGKLGGDFLCQVVERPTANIRVLGQSSLIQINKNLALFATGNNLRLVGDITRRSILSVIDSEMEQPERRSFQNDPIEAVEANRARYIEAILTIVSAYINEGSPRQPISPIGSFEDWSRLVRSPLVWLGCADPVSTMHRARAEDPELEATRDVIRGIEATFGLNKAVTCHQIIEAATGGLGRQANTDLSEALGSTYFKGRVNVRDLGNWFRRFKGRVIGNRKIESESQGKRGNKWKVVHIKEAERYAELHSAEEAAE